MALISSSIFPIMSSDASGISIATPVTLTAAPVASAAISVLNYSEVDWNCHVTASGLVTQITVSWEYSSAASPGASDWSPLNVETIAAGVSTPYQYTVPTTVAGAPYTVSWTTLVRGRWMRILIWATAGAGGWPAGSIIALTAERRV